MVGWPDRLLACTGIQLFPDLRSLQGLTTSVAVKAPVLCASTGNLKLSSTQVIDDVAVSTGDRVLVKDQTGSTDRRSESWFMAFRRRARPLRF